MNDKKMRTMKIDQENWKQMKMLAIEYEMSMNSALTVLLKKMKEK